MQPTQPIWKQLESDLSWGLLGPLATVDSVYFLPGTGVVVDTRVIDSSTTKQRIKNSL